MAIEVRDPIHGTILFNDSETAVIDSPEFQRLRAIKQLGFSDVSFPGATHSRFLHSLGVCHLSGLCFDSMFSKHTFSSQKVRDRFRSVVRLGALLHDIGHGPLSHTTEDVMPKVKELQIAAYEWRAKKVNLESRATHEDYTLKFLTDSGLTQVLKDSFLEINPLHIAALIDKDLTSQDDFFLDQGIDYRPALSQIVSSELDADRMDYLERDAYFTGTNYGRIDLNWLIRNLRFVVQDQKAYLGLSRRALYTFDDFLISRHHAHLMVYFHHKSLIYEEMLNLYLESPDSQYRLPAPIDQYQKYNDFHLYEHLSQSANPWALRIAQRKPYRMLIELHTDGQSDRLKSMEAEVKSRGIKSILASSQARLSKYHHLSPENRAYPLFVIDDYDRWDKPTPIDQSTEIFKKYEGTRVIERLYVEPEAYPQAEELLLSKRI